MIEALQDLKTSSLKPQACFCNVCSHRWSESQQTVEQRFRSIDDLVRRVNLRRDEIAMLAEIGALNSLGHDRRSAMWQVERAIRPAGELFEAARRIGRSSSTGTFSAGGNEYF